MKKRFYSHLVQTDSLIIKLDELGFAEEEKMQLLTLVESSLDHVILDAILSELSPEDKKLFLHELHSEDHEAIWRFLKTRIEKIEEKITKTAEELKEELHEDLKEVKKK